MNGFSTMTLFQLTRCCCAVSGLKSITEMEHMPYFPDLALNDFWLPALKGRFQDTEDIQKM
jgi:hypothetical protein